MKKIFLVFIALFSFTFIFSQQAELIKHLPQHTNGYLVLDNFPGATVNSWTIDIIQNTYQDFKLLNQKVIYTFRLIGRNYFKIPKEYLEMENLSIKVYAYLENGETLTREDILTMQQPGGSDWEYFKSFKCVGSTYAFEIKQFKHNSTDKSYLRVDGTAEQTDPNVVYYYRYFPLSVWQTMTLLDDVYYPFTMNQPLDLKYYHDIGNMLWNQGPEVVLLTNNSIYPYHTGDGSPILENSVIGVKKYFGPWAFPNGANCLQTGEIMKIDFADINDAISYINMYAPSNCGMKPLSCDAQTNPIPTTGAELEENIDLDDFFDLDTIVWFWDLIDIFQLQAKLSLEEYWEPYKGISIHQLSGEGNLVSSLSLTDMFSPEGERLNIPLQLEPGLYCISIHFIDGSFLRIVGEKETESYNPNTMANNLNVIIYPVPIQENYFNMNLQATENLEFNYTLYDFNGNRIYNTKVFIKEGESASIDIKPEGGIPVGYLINVFHFSDGSQLSILTVKSAQ